jgi:2-C-methyl-D-erythritol 2,4-cyclodiphosphate synthase
VASNTRTGIGYDAHPLVAGRKLVLGGTEIPFGKGLDGWSDADVLTHAIIDALLGAAALGDIGSHFPPGDPDYQGISSLKLLEKAAGHLKAAGWLVTNIDATVMAEAPLLRDYIRPMRDSLCRTLDLNVNRISIKASTANGLGFIGAGEGIAAYAIATIEGDVDESI